MKPLPRLLAFTDDRVAALPDFAQRVAAITAVGSAAGLVARLPTGSADQLASLTARIIALAHPPMASVFVTGRADIAAAAGACGVVARDGDIDVSQMRAVLQRRPAGGTLVLRSVHSLEAAVAAVDAGADGLILGSIWQTPSHPGRKGVGPAIIDRVARCGVPVWAIGGVTVERVHEAREAGAWGVAAITALWDATDVNRAALALLGPWRIPEEN